MAFALITHPASRRHVTPEGHPERVARIEVAEAALSAPEFASALRFEAPAATDEALRRAHGAAHLKTLAARAPASGFVAIDPDTYLCPDTLEAARRAAGANVMAVDKVLSGEAKTAFCALRPPGHHAERMTAMGFCFYSNAAIAALHALEAHGLARVAIADFDVHHGNGTQDILAGEARAVFCSSHEWPLFPGTGRPSERGVGNIFNAPLRAGSGRAAFERAWEDTLLPAIDAHAPELIIISAGFDAHVRDPLATLELETEDFAWITGRICDLAERHCGGRVVSTLEGGYDLRGLADSVAAHARVLKDRAG